MRPRRRRRRSPVPPVLTDRAQAIRRLRDRGHRASSSVRSGRSRRRGTLTACQWIPSRSERRTPSRDSRAASRPIRGWGGGLPADEADIRRRRSSRRRRTPRRARSRPASGVSAGRTIAPSTTWSFSRRKITSYSTVSTRGPPERIVIRPTTCHIDPARRISRRNRCLRRDDLRLIASSSRESRHDGALVVQPAATAPLLAHRRAVHTCRTSPGPGATLAWVATSPAERPRRRRVRDRRPRGSGILVTTGDGRAAALLRALLTLANPYTALFLMMIVRAAVFGGRLPG